MLIVFNRTVMCTTDLTEDHMEFLNVVAHLHQKYIKDQNQ